MIVVAGSIRVEPSDRLAFIEGSSEAVRLARATSGCQDFAVSGDPVDPARINIFELWSDRGSLDSFRADGPGDDLSSLIVSASISEFEVP